MSKIIDTAVSALGARLGEGFDGVARFDITDEGSIMIEPTGVRTASPDEEADVVLSADTDTFRAIFEGDLHPTTAFMSGRLSIEGSMGMAMKLGAALG
ncbi:SCP2 sterol-binding domain-containing protein [Alkalilacustris brevis]|uniref:SCP2 sterol-binding domain-containing protein n=1 Tax=Alkalilacustris brevis TaxID=2026338 RepID=UPI000E0CDCFB|nr:SCP2 sterol-binding domain-containing protein [Alkalilacustris brevis]